MNSTFSRRSLAKAGIATGLTATGINQLAGFAAESSDVTLKKGQTVLFQGDSITDAGRDKKNQVANDTKSLGRGYPSVIGSQLLADYPDLDLQVHNRGISGNKVPNLDKRWDKDCLDLKPDILSILIGVNDIWHKLNGRYDGTAEVYRDGLAALLDRTKKALPNVTLAICEPFVMRCGAVTDKWFPDFETRRAYAEEVAKNAGTIWVPFQQKFDEAIAAGTKPEKWAGDGVHPTKEGHELMAKVWREAVGV